MSVVASLLMMVQAVAAAPKAAEARFEIDAVPLTMPRPAGYCLPDKEQSAVRDVIAGMDDRSRMILFLVACPPADGSIDNLAVTTPNSARGVTIGRPQLLAGLGDAFKSTRVLSSIGDVDAIVSEKMRSLDPTATMEMKVEPLGRDDVCAYLGGMGDVTTATLSYRQAVGACVTAVGGKLVMVARYSDDATPAGLRTLLDGARRVALSISPARAGPK